MLNTGSQDTCLSHCLFPHLLSVAKYMSSFSSLRTWFLVWLNSHIYTIKVFWVSTICQSYSRWKKYTHIYTNTKASKEKKIGTELQMITYNMLWYWSLVDRTKGTSRKSRKTSKRLNSCLSWTRRMWEMCAGDNGGTDWGGELCDPPMGSSCGVWGTFWKRGIWEVEGHIGTTQKVPFPLWQLGASKEFWAESAQKHVCRWDRSLWDWWIWI